MAVNNKYHLNPWFHWLDSIASVVDTRSFIHQYETKYELKTGLQCGLQIDSRIIGIIGLDIHRLNQSGCIGYWLDKEYQGHGYMSNANRSLCNYYYEKRIFYRLKIRCTIHNTRRNAIPQRRGFSL